MICECGHNEEQHGPVGADRLCSLCLCDNFQVVSPDIGIDLSPGKTRYTRDNIREALKRAELAYGATLSGSLSDILIMKLKEVANETANE